MKEDELLDRVTKLKSVSIDIQGYLRNEKTTLNRLNNDYDKSIDLVKKSIGSIGSNINSNINRFTYIRIWEESMLFSICSAFCIFDTIFNMIYTHIIVYTTLTTLVDMTLNSI